MGKDRYSDDHTIEVVGDTNTLSISENVAIQENLTVGNDATIAGSLNITGDVVANNLNVADIDCDSLTTDVINSTDLVVTGSSSITLASSDISMSSNPQRTSEDIRYMTYPPASFSFQFVDTTQTEPIIQYQGAYWEIDEQSNLQNFYCPINNIPQGSRILDLTIYYAVGDSSDSISAGLYSLNFASSNTIIQHFYQALPTGPAGWTSDSVTPVSIPTIDYETKSYFIKFTAQNGTATSLYLGGARITYLTKSVGL